MNFGLHGHAVSTGITIGYAHLVSTARMEVGHYEVPQEDVESEVARFDAVTRRYTLPPGDYVVEVDDKAYPVGAPKGGESFEIR